MGETVDLLPSISIIPCADEQYSYVSIRALDLASPKVNNAYQTVWNETLYVKENVASVSVEDSKIVLARILNTIAEYLYPDDWVGSEVLQPGHKPAIRG